ncbi:hypothetical protein BHE89_17775 [Shigella sp. FC1967]|nr:hypothetical protein BHE89_17775 [Shigella sp. FC1967]
MRVLFLLYTVFYFKSNNYSKQVDDNFTTTWCRLVIKEVIEKCGVNEMINKGNEVNKSQK